jgi:hypothetical protein
VSYLRNSMLPVLDTVIYTAIVIVSIILAPLASMFGLILGVLAGFIFLILQFGKWISRQIHLRASASSLLMACVLGNII